MAIIPLYVICISIRPVSVIFILRENEIMISFLYSTKPHVFISSDIFYCRINSHVYMSYMRLLNCYSCQIPFYTLSLKTQKLMLFLILRSKRMCNVSFMRAIVVSHNLFTMVNDFLQIDICCDLYQMFHTDLNLSL